MHVPECHGLTREQEKNLKLAVEGTCELCSEYFPLQFLSIHRISRRMYREMVRDPSTRILIVCHLCHHHIHRLPVRVRDQREIVSCRSFFVRRDIRKVFGYMPKPYTPPVMAISPRCMRNISTISPLVHSGWVDEWGHPGKDRIKDTPSDQKK